MFVYRFLAAYASDEDVSDCRTFELPGPTQPTLIFSDGIQVWNSWATEGEKIIITYSLTVPLLECVDMELSEDKKYLHLSMATSRALRDKVFIQKQDELLTRDLAQVFNDWEAAP